MPGAKFWQRNYWEHIIRNEVSLNRIRDYIDRMPEMSGGPPLSSVRHAAPSSLSQKRDNAKAIMGSKPLDDSTSAAERTH